MIHVAWQGYLVQRRGTSLACEGTKNPVLAGWQRKIEARGYPCMLFQVIDNLLNPLDFSFIASLFLRPTLALLMDLLEFGF